MATAMHQPRPEVVACASATSDRIAGPLCRPSRDPLARDHTLLSTSAGLALTPRPPLPILGEGEQSNYSAATDPACGRPHAGSVAALEILLLPLSQDWERGSGGEGHAARSHT